MPVGRPTKYDPAICDRVVELGREGFTLAEMAAELDIDRSTLSDWCEKHDEFSRAVKSGLDRAQAWWEKQGRIATFGGCDGFNATSYIFQMKNRFKEDWRDKVDNHTTGQTTLNIVTGVPR
jgi:transposase